MKTITLQMLLKQMADDARANRGCGVFFLVLVGLCLAGGGAAVHPILSVLVLGVFLLGGWSMLSSSRKTRKSLKTFSFYLTTDICKSKDVQSDGENGDSHMLTFEGGYTHTIDHGDVALNAAQPGCFSDWLYDQTQLGDRFWLLYLEGESKPMYILSQRLCCLNMAEFVAEGDRLRPRKLTDD